MICKLVLVPLKKTQKDQILKVRNSKMKLSEIKNKKLSPWENWTLVSNVKSRDTHHFTNMDNTSPNFPQRSVKTEKSFISKRLKCFQVNVFMSFCDCHVIKSTNTSHWNCFTTQKNSRKIQPLWQSSKMFSSNGTFI